MWRQRKNDGPYQIIPSKNLSNITIYEGGWEGLKRNKNNFLANPIQARWIVSPFPPVKWESNNPPLKASKRMCDAAFVALVENDVALANLVRDHLLWQAQESTTDFTNTDAWQRTYNHIGEVQPNLVGSNWGLSHVYAYDYIKDVAELSPEQKNIILSWLRGMGEYYMAVARAAIDLLFINPYIEDYRLSSYAKSIYNNYPQTLKTHANGYVIENLHKFFNNRRYSLVRCAAMIGVLLNDAFLKDRASRCFKEYLKFGMYPDGMISDYEKAFDANGAPVSANLGWKYSIVPLAVLTDIADAFARSGDKSLFEYKTSEGALGSEGGPKSLRKGIVTFCKHVDGQTKFDEGATLHYQDGFLDDYTRIISTDNTYNNDNRFTSFHDIVVAMANLYYKDSYVQGTYMRTNPGSPPFNTANVVVEVGGSDNIEIWGGGFDGMPDILFMYGQMEDKYNPYTDIAINSPADKASFITGSSINLEVTATAPNTSISKVEFYNGATKLGEALSSPYSYTWDNPPAGSYTITARAIDNMGAVTNSSEVNITVKLPNQAPTVNVNAPVSETKFIAPATITIDASANDTDGTISKVEFFDGTTMLEEDTDGTNGWSYTWSNVSIGTYAITARATDNEGEVATSAVVSITVKAPNQLPVVNAGSDQTITLPVNSIILTGTASDPDGSIATYAWSKQSGPAANLNGVNTETLTVNDLIAGSYVFRLAVTDDEGALAFDEVVVLVNAAPDVAITSPANNAAFTAPASITITANASDSDGTITKVEFFNGTTMLGEDLTAPYSFSWSNVEIGTYSITARATDNTGSSTTSTIVKVIVNSCTASGSILRELWTNISGTAITVIPSTAPATSTLTLFEAPTNFANNYLQRIRGYICVPATGSYTFYIASDDNSELYLSTDDNSTNKIKIASVTGTTKARQWTKYASQKSKPITLQAGRRYYIEALHKEGTGNDNLAVGWLRPGSTTIAVIPGSVLSAFSNSVARIGVSEEASQEIPYIVYPNPFEDEITINFDSGESRAIVLTVVDLLGRKYYQNGIILAKGDTKVSINLSDKMLKPGLYYLKIKDAISEEKVVKLLKK